MKRGITWGLRRFLRSEDGAHGAGSAVLAGAVACALVLAASVFGQDAIRTLKDFWCESSPGCAVAVQRTDPPANDAPKPRPAAYEKDRNDGR
jgi:Flp pilus assembly pilin Flp